MTDKIKVHVTLDPEEHGVAGEYLWAEPADDGDPTHYKVSNIPFYATMLALHDIVEVGPAEPSPDCEHGGSAVCQWCRAPEVIAGVTESGQETGRLFFETHLSDAERKEIGEKILARGGQVEWADAHLLSFSIDISMRVDSIVGEWVHDKKIAICDLEDA